MSSKKRWRSKAFKAAIRARLLKLFGKKTRGVLVHGETGYFIVDPQDSHVSRQLLQTGSYNPAELKEILKLVTPESRILVVGGHIGSMVVPLAKIAREVYVIEANPNTFELLTLNIRLNSLTNVKLFPLAANDRSGKLKFVMNTENSGGSKRLPLTQKENYFYDSPQVVEVRAVPLDELFPTEKFDIILMDIEGSEYFAIQGMPKLINNCNVFIFEFIPDHLCHVSGISVEQFFSALSTTKFSRAFLPKQNKSCSFEDLCAELKLLVAKDQYEDGIFLFK